MKILVLNAGSSSLKYALYEISGGAERIVCEGAEERVTSMTEAIHSAFMKIAPAAAGSPIDGVGYRVVHGGSYPASMVFDPEVERRVEELCELAPLHNPHSLAAFRAAREHLPNAVHVAVFDTAFHQTIPAKAHSLAVRPEYAERGIRRYGFHGISHRSVALRFTQLTARPIEDLKLIVCHLGNGCSICAVDGGKSIDTSMGFTPLEGLVMGTRSGDFDTSALLHLIVREGRKPEDMLNELNKQAGLVAVSGVSNDMRDVIAAADAGNTKAQLAIDMFCYRARKYVGAYLAAMNGADALIFTGGMGERSARIRAGICENLSALGIKIDSQPNESESTEARLVGNSRVAVWVIPTEEQALIARDTAEWVRRKNA